MAKQKFILLLPLDYNDGTEVPRSVLNRIYDEIFGLAGGHYTAGVGQGAYRMQSGQKQVDHCAQVWVVIEETKVPQLRSLVARFAELLDQESMYLECAGTANVQFISRHLHEESHE